MKVSGEVRGGGGSGRLTELYATEGLMALSPLYFLCLCLTPSYCLSVLVVCELAMFDQMCANQKSTTLEGFCVLVLLRSSLPGKWLFSLAGDSGG